MGTGDGPMQPLTVDPELLERYGNQLLTAAGGLPEAPPPFTVTGTDPMSQAIADRLPAMEGAIQEQLPQLKDQASKTASTIVSAAGVYRDADQQNASDIERAQFASAAGSAGSGAGGEGAMGQMGQLMSMPMQMAGQVMQVPMQAMGALASLPQSVMQGVQQIGQMAGGLGGAGGTLDSQAAGAGEDAGKVDDRREESEDEKKPGAAPAHARLERVPEPAVAPQSGSPRHAAPDSTVDL